jgi:hypothetical protein
MLPLDDKDYLLLAYKEDMLDKPVFKSPQGYINGDNTKAWTYSSCHQAIQALAFRAGYRHPITSYYIRRGVANTLFGPIPLSLNQTNLLIFD